MPLSHKPIADLGLAPNVCGAIIIITLFLITFFYDAIALMFFGDDYTVSYVIKSWSKHFPILPLIMGILMGHLFWPIDPNLSPTPKESLLNHHGSEAQEAIQKQNLADVARLPEACPSKPQDVDQAEGR